ncbi:hypothetical protein BDV95DRAFT_592080 [Massariosphaeria phaeospora]|uniref:Mid2 domain-containing protein n=1 Tax=Massariosphaeria phaeospora TaxID=100035 RepID=A0A7C8MAG3_9PLEO|nr:hypothetical protein BDV95DRAFT_592080 [Massariosphaeria phaeospora]
MRSKSLALCALSSVTLIHAHFTVPDSSAGDFKETYIVGETMNIKWAKGWERGIDGDQPDRVDLWLDAYNLDRKTDFEPRRLKSNVNLDKAGSMDWKVNVDKKLIEDDPQFVLRFINVTESSSMPENAPQMPSVGFILVDSADSALLSTLRSSAASRTASATASRASIPAGIPSTPPAPGEVPNLMTSTSTTPAAAEETDSGTSAPSTPGQSGTKKKTNTGAIAGGVLGGLIGLAAILAGLLFALKAARKKKEAMTAGGVEVGYSNINGTGPLGAGGAGHTGGRGDLPEWVAPRT